MNQLPAIPTAYPGRAIVGMENMYSDFEGNLFIPRNAPSRQILGRIGFVCSITLYPENQKSWIYDRGEKKAVHAWRENACYQDMFERYVVCEHARMMWGQLYSVRLEHIVCAVPKAAKASPDELGRCTQCTTARTSKGVTRGILLGPDGYCPVCGFNILGKHKLEEVIDVTEEDINEFVRMPMEMDHIMRTGGKRLTNTAYSFPGQKGKEPTFESEARMEIDDIIREQERKRGE